MLTARSPIVRTRIEHPASHWPQIVVTHFSGPLGALTSGSASWRKFAILVSSHPLSPPAATPAPLTPSRVRHPRLLLCGAFFSTMRPSNDKRSVMTSQTIGIHFSLFMARHAPVH